MSVIRVTTLGLATLLVAGCASSTGKVSPTFKGEANWGMVPMVNYSQTPQAGERSEQILISVLTERGLQPKIYPPAKQTGHALADESERLAAGLEWARRQQLDYVISGSVEEWQYKSGLDGEPAVGISLRVLDPATGGVLWSNSGARAGWSRESLAGTAQKVIGKLVDDLRLD